MENNNNSNGKKLEHRLTKLEVQLDVMKEKAESNHKEIIAEFKMLRAKVNEEITTMNEQIEKVTGNLFITRKHFIRTLAIVIIVGTFIWVKESRDWILKNIFHLI